LEEARAFLANLDALSTTLRTDVEEIAAAMTFQSYRRHYLRAFFAWVEAENHVRRQVSLLLAATANFSIAEFACLQEETYVLDEQGRCQTRPTFGRLLGSTRFSFAAFLKATGGTYEPNYGDKGWCAFRSAVDMRHRLTHPKTANELQVSDEEIAVLSTAVRWYVEASKAASGSAVAALDALNR